MTRYTGGITGSGRRNMFACPLCTDTQAEQCPQTPGSICIICVVLYFPLYSIKPFRLTSFSQAILVYQRKEEALG